MAMKLGPLDIACDALPYPIVQACERLGFRSPLDVPWTRMSQHLSAQNEGAGFFSSVSWLLFLQRSQPQARTCSCGGALPNLERYTFLFPSGNQVEYHLGQCGRCHKMFWQEVLSTSSMADV
jgi:hypothetical protein